MSDLIDRDDLLDFIEGSIEEHRIQTEAQKPLGRRTADWNAGVMYALERMHTAVLTIGDDISDGESIEQRDTLPLH